MDFLYALEIIGTFFFAISGIRLAAKKDMDLFGAAVIGFVTATGGGTTRDILLGSYPVLWVEDLNYPLVIFLALPFTLIFSKYIVKMQRTIFIFDTACLIGAVSFYLLQQSGSPTDVNYIVTVLIIVIIRIVAIRKNLAFPKMK
ncbi:MAG: TRIC cation channel family protein [Cyclobacteriaceae bacterium]